MMVRVFRLWRLYMAKSWVRLRQLSYHCKALGEASSAYYCRYVPGLDLAAGLFCKALGRSPAVCFILACRQDCHLSASTLHSL